VSPIGSSEPPAPDRSRAAADRGVAERVDALASWINEIDLRLRTAEIQTGDEKTAKELRKAVEAMAKHDPKLEERIGNRVDVLADRFTTLATTVSTTTAALAGKDGDIAALRKELEERLARVEAAAADSRGATTNMAEIDELRRAIDAVSEQKLPKKLDSRVDDLRASVAGLAQRMETLSSFVSTTASGLAGREGEVASLRRKLDEDAARLAVEISTLRNAVDPAPVAELRRVLDTVATEMSALTDDSRRKLDATTTSMSALAKRVDEVVATVSAATSQLAAGHGRVETLQSTFDEEISRVDALLVKLHHSVVEVGGKVAELDALPSREAVDEIGTGLADIVQRVESLGQTVTETASGYAQKEHEVAALSRRLEEMTAQVDDGVRELRSAIDEMSASKPDAGLAARVEELVEQIGALEGRLATADASSSADWDGASELIAALQQRIAEVTERLDTAEASAAGATAEATLAAQGWAEERATLLGTSKALEERVAELGIAIDESGGRLAALQEALETGVGSAAGQEAELQALGTRIDEARAQVDGLVQEVRDALASLPEQVGAEEAAERLGDVLARIETLEQSRATAALEIARASATWSEERTSIRDDITAGIDLMRQSSEAAAAELARATETWATDRSALQSRLDELVAAVAESQSRADSDSERLILELGERIEQVERERAALASELAGATAFWSSGLGALEARMNEVTAAKDSEPRKVDDEVVRALFDLARRLDTVERERAAGEAEIARATESWIAERHSLAAGLDELTERLESVAGDGHLADGATASVALAANEGRFRLELRALELRMEHAEAAARENREAVLVQLERLASRIEWRLQRLETGKDDGPLPEAADGPLAQVVSIHGGDV
jgi:chromosome segregation ATPase